MTWWWMAAAEKRRKTTWVRCDFCAKPHKVVRGAFMTILPCPAADPTAIRVYQPKW